MYAIIKTGGKQYRVSVGDKLKVETLAGEKVRIFKFRRRKHSMKSAGHRQNYTELKIEAIAA